MSGPTAGSTVSAEASKSFEVNATGLYQLQFSLTGEIDQQAGLGQAYFSVIGDGLDAQWQSSFSGHYFKIDETFTTDPNA